MLRKLCGTLAFLCTLDREVGAETVVRRLVLSVAHGRAVDCTVMDLPDLHGVVKGLSDAQWRLILWFLTAFCEEAGKEINAQDRTYVLILLFTSSCQV